MKKFLFFATLSCVALAGCTKNEPAVDNTPLRKIGFDRPVTTVPSKTVTNAEIGTVYNATEHFSVYAAHTTAAWATSAADASSVAPSVYMVNVDCAYNNTTNAWDPETGTGGKAYYWPKNGYLTFQAYSPTAASTYVNHSWATGLTFTNFVVADAGSQYDLLYSDRVYDKQSCGTINDGAGVKDDDNDSGLYIYNGIDILFKHALSSIVFKVRQADAYTGTTIKVKQIEILNAYNKGTFAQNLGDNATNAYSSAPAWTVDTAAGNEVATYTAFTGTYTTTTTLTAPGTTTNAMLLLPQPLSHDATNKTVQVKVTYSITSTGGDEIDQVSTVSIASVKDSADNSITAWEIGKRYTYNIVISLDKIYFDPAVVDYTNVIMSEITI